MFETLTAPLPDQIIRLMRAYAEDPRPDKIDLGVGVYRTETGETPVMAAVRAAQDRLCRTETTKSYVALTGDPAFLAALSDLVLGPVPAGRLAAAATPGGTGALRQALELVRRARPGARVWVSAPSWPNHAAILDAVGLAWTGYRYHDGAGGLDPEGMLADLAQMAPGDVVLLHGCCHNPTGIDPGPADWQALARLIASRGAVPLVDLAYLGLGDGPEEDAAGLRLLAATLPEILVAVSGSKSFGLYRDRVGAVLALCGEGAAEAVQATLATLNRQNFAFPPDHGARLVTLVLSDPALRTLWDAELSAMRARVQAMRQALAGALAAETGTDRFAFLTRHRGMFSLIGATPEQVAQLRRTQGIYMVGDGRINLAGLRADQIGRLARALARTLTQ